MILIKKYNVKKINMQNRFAFEKIEIFGEVLFDFFENNTKTIGGAPFNVACHLNMASNNSLKIDFITKLGADLLGKEALSTIKEKKISAKEVQIDEKKPTGTVNVFFKENNPCYEIKEDVAFDYIKKPFPVKEKGKTTPGENKSDKHSLFYHGTLAARNKETRKTLYDLTKRKKQKIFCDLNLRDPYWTKELLKDILRWSTYIKLNQEELKKLTKALGINYSEIDKNTKALLKVGKIESIILTMGSEGATLYQKDGYKIYCPAKKTNSITDTVGAGDAFSAVCILGIYNNWIWEETLQKAVDFATEICKIKGAVPKRGDIYEKYKL